MISTKLTFALKRFLKGQQQNVRHLGQAVAMSQSHLLQVGEVTPGIPKEEFSSRRNRLMELIHKSPQGSQIENHLVIIPSATKLIMSHDIPYFFHQNTDFLYFSGFMEPDSVLILETKTGWSLPHHKSTLFVPKKDPIKELWEGKRLGIEGSVQLTGVDEAFNSDDIHSYLSHYIREKVNFSVWYDYKKPNHLEFHEKTFNSLFQMNNLRYVNSLSNLIQSLRLYKSDNEIKLLRESCRIGSSAFNEVMQFSYPGVKESHLQAKMDYECRIQNADHLSFPPVVAGGNRANTIHYINNNQIIEPGELVLMDAGCEYHGYSSDLTRTWPISGEFSPAQKVLYEGLLDVQKKCILLAESGTDTLDTIYWKMLRLLGQFLQDSGCISKSVSEGCLYQATRRFCPHHVGHYLGMDVHDSDGVSRSTPLKPGMAITIEPGIYIPDDRSDVPVEFRGNGMRIEDNILITDHGIENLSQSCQKELKEIENIKKLS